MKIATTKERILQFIEFKGISKQNFFKQTELKRGFLDADKLKTSIPDIFVAIIVAKFPEINVDWLISGHGEMLKSSESAEGQQEEGYKSKYLELIEKYAALQEKYAAVLERKVEVAI